MTQYEEFLTAWAEASRDFLADNPTRAEKAMAMGWFRAGWRAAHKETP